MDVALLNRKITIQKNTVVTDAIYKVIINNVQKVWNKNVQML